ncbi:GTP pyrophosphokinase rsh [Candidatus Filomicrobium marinum]|uniref:GTP pyrophosphokinase rsh n=1 Tax=Candidatus Filomicrobium marinum TaxID=1608628 RepID=A0A0D6JHS5_9HYPH|nr:bifunctional (p)ppGpp synthetase/guanosine-3',5'-bis(diphosphate) 3'-pyrophosphohydrolase [Candidatus Filomicrobium marinum]CFX42336.1 GTP pyrophosphokinase rsh [Candidatus Filomicrobium marinum]CPR21092.1 GTP pyrophosphokinase rsh [Candidatus Filomicrobium marinum]
MMRQYELVERVTKYDPGADEVLLNRAYVYAMKAHGHQKRASGDPYFSHPLEVAAILTDLHLDSATITTALLHDVIEDTDATRAEIDQLFGAEIGALVDGLTKIKRLDLVSKQAEQAENFRKLLIAISSDIRVLLVKLADRLHNMRTLEYMKPASRQRISEETLEVYAPLAGRMGMQAMREELEDLSFRWLYPEAYETVVHKLVDIHEKNEGLVEEIRIALEAKLSDVGMQAAVHGREKKPYSIWRKMQNKQIGLEQLSDIYGFRIIVENIADCYRVLGVAHTTWRTVPGRFKDYISTPKQNGYQSIHTTIVGPRHQRVELQIRTKEMHDVAEYGVAAHTFYKEPTNGASGNGSSTVLNPDSGPYHWLRRLVDTLLEGSNPVEFLEHTKLELFQDQVFCFSPKGRLIALPHGATPLDFAYAVHTDIGNAAVGAYINGRHMPIDTQLRNGDEVEILTSKTHTPPAAWEHFAVTGRARSAIRRAARDTMRRQYTELGRRLVTSALQAQSESYSDDRLKGALPRIAGGKTVEDVLAGVARNEIAVDEVVRAILPDANLPALAKSPRAKARRHQPSNQEGWFNLSKVMGLKFRVGQEIEEGMSLPGSIPLRGLKSDIPVTFEDGGAVPGDRIVGVLTPGEGIRIFQIHSPRLKAYEHERWIDVTWDINRDQPERFPARIAVTALNEPGTLAQIAHVIGEASGNIDQVRMVGRGPDFTKMLIEVEVWDLEHLNMILSGLKSQSVVSHADRVFD